ncbi:hypothetical protein QNA23_10985 [Rhodococcus erythropolis]|uniref:hypothetical protein n=1 Tax=Rhodococcus erythropolis TaxID=1833 RepID=UPI0024BBCFA2|nr:hypothetical protein [Rhodococcus erythropolis]MDJ0404007.1 hypothetical protein [Rhodococcus erythropolis]
MTEKKRGVTLDIIEVVAPDRVDGMRHLNVLKPNLIRINGVPVLVPKDSSIEIEPITSTDAIVVRMSMFVGELNIGFETKGEPLSADEKAEREVLNDYVSTQGAIITDAGLQ